MEKVMVAVRLPLSIKQTWQALAERQGRSMANYLERLLERENEQGDRVTLDTLDGKLDCLIELHRKENKPKKSINGDGKKKLTAYDMDFDREYSVRPESWKLWIDHLHRCDVHLNHYQASIHFDKFIELRKDEWDCNNLIEDLIKEGARKIYLPYEWKLEEKKEKLINGN